MRGNALEAHHLAEVLKRSARKLGERRGANAVAMLCSRLEDLLRSGEDDAYSYIWRAAVEDHAQDAHRHDIRGVLVSALRDAALGATLIPCPGADKAVRQLLASPFAACVRVGIYVCGENYRSVGHVFWEEFQTEWLSAVVYWHEMFWFIKKNFDLFSAEHREKYLDEVRSFQGSWKDGVDGAAWDARHRRDLLLPAVGLGHPGVDADYEALVQKWGPSREHPDFHSYMVSGWMGERSPISSEQILALNDQDLVSFIRGFKPTDNTWDGPSHRGLADAIVAAVRASPDGFAGRIALFQGLSRPAQHGLLYGLKLRWSEDKREVAWDEALQLMNAIASDPGVSEELSVSGQGFNPNIGWVLSDIAALVEAATEMDRAPKDVVAAGIRVLDSILDACAADAADEHEDAVSHAINSPRGKALEALVKVALWLRRSGEQDSAIAGEVWKSIHSRLEKELATSELGQNAEFAAIGGLYVHNLHFLNPGWVELNFDRLMSLRSNSAWRCAAEGLSYQRYLYEWMFRRLRDGGHLRRMIFEADMRDSVLEKGLEFLALAYLQSLEDLEPSSLLGDVVASLDARRISHLCWFFWTLRDGQPEANPQISGKVLQFWSTVAGTIRRTAEPHARIQSALSMLAAFIESDDKEVFANWRMAAPHADVAHHSHHLVENLNRLSGRFPQPVAQVFLVALDSFLPQFDPADIQSCVERLASAGAVQQAEEICNAYTKHGSVLLKDTYTRIRASARTK